MEDARAAGHDDKAALKLGNAAYRAKARELQDHYYEHVSPACGLTRTGAKRERLSRQQWRARKDAAKLTAQITQEIDGRLEDVVDAEDGLKRSLAANAEDIAEKLDLADWVIAEAEQDRREAQRLQRQAEVDAQQMRDTAIKENEALRRKLVDQNWAALAKDRKQLRLAQAQTDNEADRLRTTRSQFGAQRTRLLRDTAAETARMVLRLFLGVLDGTVRPNPPKASWIIDADDLRERTERSGLIGLIAKVLSAFHEAWQRMARRLSGAEQKDARDRVSEPIKQVLTSLSGGPAR